MALIVTLSNDAVAKRIIVPVIYVEMMNWKHEMFCLINRLLGKIISVYSLRLFKLIFLMVM